MKNKYLNKKNIVKFILIILIIFAIRAWQQQDLTHGIVPSFSSKTLNGKIMSSDLQENNATLIHFWATWCTVCKFENDNIQNISQDYRVLNIAMQSGSNEEIKKYAEQNNLKLDNIINDKSGSIARLFGVKGTPSSFFITPNGKIKFIEVGYVSEIGYRLRLWWAGF